MVTPRYIRVDEKLFASYGTKYWFEWSSISDVYKNRMSEEPGSHAA